MRFPDLVRGEFLRAEKRGNLSGKKQSLKKVTVQQSFWVRENFRPQMLFDEAVWENFPEIGATVKGESTEDGKNNSLNLAHVHFPVLGAK